MYRNFKSQLGYENGENKIDSYGVDHSNFSLRDEVSYQMARTNRENELIKNYNNQGITQDYPQYNTNFWGNNPANNYGFGSSNISDNIENVTNSLKNQNYGFDTNTNNIKPNNVYNTVGNNGTFNTANIQTPPQTLNQLPANRLNKANSMELFNNPPSSQMDLSLKPLNKSNSYTTESAWGFPNTKSANVEQIWANNPSNNKNFMTDDDLYKAMWQNIQQYENVLQHPYLDTKGLITVGGGANVNNWNDFKKVNFTINGVPATEAEKLAAYNIMRNLSNEKDENGNPKNWNTQAEAFKKYTNIRISDDEARSLAQNHMTNDLAHIRREFSDFDTFPQPLKEVLLDIQYNVKGGLNEAKWPNLYKAIRERNINGYNGIYYNVNRPDVKHRRNDWARRMINSINQW